MHADHCGDEQELRHEVPVHDGIDGVLEAATEAQVRSSGNRIQAQAVTGKGAGTHRRDRRSLPPVPQPGQIAQEGLDVLADPGRPSVTGCACCRWVKPGAGSA